MLKGIFNWVELTKVTVCGTPLKVTVAVETNFVPVMVRVSAAAP